MFVAISIPRALSRNTRSSQHVRRSSNSSGINSSRSRSKTTACVPRKCNINITPAAVFSSGLSPCTPHKRPGPFASLPVDVCSLSHGLFCTSFCRRLQKTKVCSRYVGAIYGSGTTCRSFGGQSVVPWELALFLVEEMKGEGVPPGAVVYTAALAECRWAGEMRHVEYILSQLRAEELDFAPGIPGATNDEPPPSQIPAIYKSTSSADPGASSTSPPTAATTAGRIAEAALATVEGMWAAAAAGKGGGGAVEPTPATSRAALDACAAGGQWERALSLVRDSALDADEGDADDHSLAGRVEVLALHGRWLEALDLVKGAI